MGSTKTRGSQIHWTLKCRKVHCLHRNALSIEPALTYLLNAASAVVLLPRSAFNASQPDLLQQTQFMPMHIVPK